MLTMWSMNAMAEHTATLSLSSMKVSGCTYDSSSQTVTFPEANYKAAYWDMSDAMKSFTTVTVTVGEHTIPVRISVRYTPTGASETSDIAVTLATNETTVEAGEKRGSVTMPTDATTITGFTVKDATNPNKAVSQTLTLKKAYLTTEEIVYFDMNVTKTLKVAGTAGQRSIYEVSMKSVPETADENAEPVTIYGYYAEPENEGTYPCIIHFHGTSKNKAMDVPSATSNPEWCEYYFSARGQTLDWEKNGNTKYRTKADDESSVDFYAYELGDNDKHYYRYVYLDTRRAVDFVCSQAKVNKNAVFAAGGSQGGCLTYVCAWLALSNSQQAPSFFLLDDGETTAISTVNRDPFTMNQYYDLQGRRVVQPVKGLYIVNGKKVVIK